MFVFKNLFVNLVCVPPIALLTTYSLTTLLMKVMG
jgi:hypothetical protein